MNLINKHSFIVFDLDDTLYKEDDYHTSGLLAVAGQLQKMYGSEVSNKILDWKRSGVKDIWAELCTYLKLPDNTKDSFIWLYRLHKPNITLSAEVKNTLHFSQEHAAGIAILTDGRAITQRLKLAALGLQDIPCYISEEYQSEKPNPERFQLIQDEWPGLNYIYIGDNPKKDFLAPNTLGWTTIGLKGNEQNIHSQDTSNLDANYLPSLWVSKLEDLLNLLC